jgi:hypothetical protein
MTLNYDLLLHLSLCTYIASWLFVDGHIFDTPRFLVINATGFLRFGGYHVLECRTCFSFWFALAACISLGEIGYVLPVWAISRILQRQERPVE